MTCEKMGKMGSWHEGCTVEGSNVMEGLPDVIPAESLTVNVAWEFCGYTNGLEGPKIPEHFDPVIVGTPAKIGDYAWMGSRDAPSWMKLGGEVFSSTCLRTSTSPEPALTAVKATWTYHIRPRNLVAMKAMWYCNSASCQDRENDVGFPCYWCGAKEKR